MRQLVFLTMLAALAGCHAARERLHCRRGCVTEETCAPAEKKPVGSPAPRKADKEPEKVAAPGPSTPEFARAAVAQEVLLVPRMVYVPFVAQTPTAPVRLTPNMTVANPQGGPEPLGNPAPVGAPPCKSELKEALEACRKIQQRCDYLEKCLRERAIPAPACPPQRILPSLFRRPLFNRCDPMLPMCDVPCEPLQSCEPIPMSPSSAVPLGMPKNAAVAPAQP